MNLPQIDWKTVCLCIWDGQRQTAKKVEADEIQQKPWTTGRVMIPTFIDYPALVGRFERLCWLYTQPGDWSAPAWSMLPQVKRAVPSARRLLFLAARGVLSIAEVSLSCRSSWQCQTLNLILFLLPKNNNLFLFTLLPPPHTHTQCHPIPSHSIPCAYLSLHFFQWLDLYLLHIEGVKINNIISTLSQFSIKDFEVHLSRRIHHSSSASESSSPDATAEQWRFHNQAANMPLGEKHRSAAAVRETEDMTVCLTFLSAF